MIINMFTVCLSVHLFIHIPTPTQQANLTSCASHTTVKEHFFSSQCCLIQSDFIMTRTERIFKHSFDLRLMELRVWNENLKLNELWGKNSWARHLLLANIRDAVQQQTLNSDRCVGEARKGNISEYAGEEAGQKEYRAKHCSSRWRRNITYPHLQWTLRLQGWLDWKKKVLEYTMISFSQDRNLLWFGSSTSVDTNETWQATVCTVTHEPDPIYWLSNSSSFTFRLPFGIHPWWGMMSSGRKNCLKPSAWMFLFFCYI